jgi:hypothetical protein
VLDVFELVDVPLEHPKMAAMMFLTSPVHHAHTPPPHPNPDKSLLSSTAALEKEEHPSVFSFEKEEGSPNLLHCHSLTILQYHHYPEKSLSSQPMIVKTHGAESAMFAVHPSL